MKSLSNDVGVIVTVAVDPETSHPPPDAVPVSVFTWIKYSVCQLATKVVGALTAIVKLGCALSSDPSLYHPLNARLVPLP